MTIEKVENGYIVTSDSSWRERKVFETLDDVFEEMLMAFEGRCKNFGGASYGKVTIRRGKGERQ